MAEQPTPEDFRSQLLQQDEGTSSERYKEHRMQLEQQLIEAESRERMAKRIVIGALITAFIAFLVAGSQILGSPDPSDDRATPFSMAVGAIYVVAWIVFFVGVASYFSRFMPRLRRAREDVLQASIHELRNEIRELRESVRDKR
jgi:hypothetical protein